MYGLGVDLGTSFVAAAISEAGEARPLVLGPAGVLAPAVVRSLPDGSLVTGEAPEPAGDDPGSVVRGVKRRLGDPSTLLLGGRPHSAASLLAVLLRSVVDSATEQQGRAPDHVALTYPAVWGPYRREQFEEVARLAGIGDVTLVTEPEAAALPHQRNARHRPGDVLAVYDLGGGTFDTAVVRLTERGADVLGAPEGLEWVGGVDFDEAVMAWVDRALDGAVSALDRHDPADRAILRRLHRECVRGKEALSHEHTTRIVAPLPGRSVELRLARADLEALIRAPLEATLASLRRAVRSAALEPEDLTGVLLAGGSSRIPLVTHLLEETFHLPVLTEANPKVAVAMGAALVADAVLAGVPADVPAGTVLTLAAAHGGGAPRPVRPRRAAGESGATITDGAVGSAGSGDAPGVVGLASGVKDGGDEQGPPRVRTTPRPRPGARRPTSGVGVPAPRRDRRRLFPLAAGLIAVLAAGAAGFALSAVNRDSPSPTRAVAPATTPPVTTPPVTSPPATTPPATTPPAGATPAVTPSAAGNPAPGTTPAAPAPWFRIVNVNSGKCVGYGGDPGWVGAKTVVVQRTCAGDDRRQQWRFEPAGAGALRVVNRRLTSQVWSADAHSGPDDNGTIMQLRRYERDPSQQWTPVARPGSRFNFVVLGSGKCLDVSDAGKSDGVVLQQWDCDDTNEQLFRRVAVG